MCFRMHLIAWSCVLPSRLILVLVAQFLLVIYCVPIIIVKHSEVPDMVRLRPILSDPSVQGSKLPNSLSSTVISELLLVISVFQKYNPGNLK